jgi:class 3 adenylate cyclase
MAADIVGYSRLIESNEAATLATIKALRAEVIDPLLAEHNGRIVKLMGDGALVEFHSVVDAVACAVAVQNGVAAHQAKSRLISRVSSRSRTFPSRSAPIASGWTVPSGTGSYAPAGFANGCQWPLPLSSCWG